MTTTPVLLSNYLKLTRLRFSPRLRSTSGSPWKCMESRDVERKRGENLSLASLRPTLYLLTLNFRPGNKIQYTKTQVTRQHTSVNTSLLIFFIHHTAPTHPLRSSCDVFKRSLFFFRNLKIT